MKYVYECPECNARTPEMIERVDAKPQKCRKCKVAMKRVIFATPHRFKD